MAGRWATDDYSDDQNDGVPADGDLPTLEFADHHEWSRWLAANHPGSLGVWLRIAKKGAPRQTVRYPDVLDVAICHGWIDGRREALDEHFFLQRFTPRRPRSRWSKVNTEKAERLIAERRMAPAGLAEVDAARADGRWADAYEPQSRAAPAEDFLRALDADPAAREFFGTLRGAARYAFIYRLANVKRADAREQRIAEYVRILAQGRTLHDR
jgi:uncharacterized protein YdeI (YjbR/CyaY-like superfamily)